MMVNVATLKQQQLVGVGSRSQWSDSLPTLDRLKPSFLLSSTSAPVCVRINWKTALDKYTIQVLITAQQLLITYLLTAELKVSIISFNKQLLYGVGNVRILSMIPLRILFQWIKIFLTVWGTHISSIQILINMNVDPIHNIHMLSTVSNIRNDITFYTVSWGRSDTVVQK